MSSNSEALLDSTTRIRVSSALDKSVGKKYLTDGSSETCWTSQQGLPQYIHVFFESAVIPRTVHLTFQGGFVGKRCLLQILPSSAGEETPALKDLTTVFPEDVNRKQFFELPETGPIEQLKLIFEESSDFFGRITVYDIQIEGQPAAETQAEEI
ncbi:uncharacterized protein FOMMEDRAFT_136871 [Fomitiporia mediterranea MF3/22]|uniref:uncharacterized protein n=1 Tax=Fomitiporia mediterranea (strain MF3/22) TaxID=694068 RepID=UPI0004408A9A|nr:uncharacterized protein FOMMEDRAFT_136871 [Fomitiporia mediterranea MF3/22]EJC98654.1 hypothetical protein FOMMEDRAFT_136871 [Fomitiporia mediterranea MF3/22]